MNDFRKAFSYGITLWVLIWPIGFVFVYGNCESRFKMVRIIVIERVLLAICNG